MRKAVYNFIFYVKNCVESRKIAYWQTSSPTPPINSFILLPDPDKYDMSIVSGIIFNC